MTNGSKWYKFDIHTHTPYSYDYGRGDTSLKARVTAKEWLSVFVKEKIQCVVITDHNTGEAIDSYKAAAEELQNDGTDIVVFPGVEISAHGGVHIIAIFDPSKTSDDIATLLGAVQYRGKRGESDKVTELVPQKVIEIIKEHGGVAIPAHIDKAAGYCKELSGQTLKQALAKLDAVEVIDRDSETLNAYRSYGLKLAELRGSDSHHPDEVGRAFSWLKMAKPNIDGFKLALMEGAGAICRSDQEGVELINHTPGKLIVSLSVKKTKYIGAKKPFEICFNPWLNSIIGGRGSGKSSLVEFLRIAMGREKELSPHHEINRVFQGMNRVPLSKNESGLLRSDTQFEVIYKKDDVVYKIVWMNSKSEIYRYDQQEWRHEEGLISERFPVRVFSQKQIFEISKNTNALFKFIDESPQVELADWKVEFKRELNNYKRLRTEERANASEIMNKSKFEGERADISSRLSSLTKANHDPRITLYRRLDSVRGFIRGHQPSAVDSLKSALKSTSEIRPLYLPENTKGDTTAEIEMYSRLAGIDKVLLDVKEEVLELLEKASGALSEFSDWYEESDFMYRLKTVVPAVQAAINAENQLGSFNSLQTALDIVESNLIRIEKLESEQVDLLESIQKSYDKILGLRKLLTERRVQFVETYFSNIDSISVEISQFGDCVGSTTSFSTIFGKNEKQHNSGIDYDVYNAEIVERLTGIINRTDDLTEKARIVTNFKEQLLSGTVFGEPVSRKIQEQINHFKNEIEDRVLEWFPEDELKVSFKDKNGRYKNILNGSAGQRSAAILSLVLSYGSEPLILDQPEDDLDNKLIGSLIIEQLKNLKSRRQVIVVTHNANIVVNGNSEMIIGLEDIKGQAYVKASGGLQESDVKHHVCEVMEGGKDLLENRYKRIMRS
ncbi:TrlF family AAA-like ATPase [Pseudomonas pergaminensis]